MFFHTFSGQFSKKCGKKYSLWLQKIIYLAHIVQKSLCSAGCLWPYCIQTKLRAWGETVGAQCPGLDERILWFPANWVQTLADSQLPHSMRGCDNNAERYTCLYCSGIALPPLYTVRIQLISISLLGAASFFFYWWMQPCSFHTFSHFFLHHPALKTKSWAKICRLSSHTLHVYTTVVWSETEKCRWKCTSLSQCSVCCWDVYFLFCRKCMLGSSIFHAATVHRFNTHSLRVTS